MGQSKIHQLTTQALTPIGLRVDVDTLRGTRQGVPELVQRLAAAEVKASFFFSVGPDNMGRNLYRLLKPRFAWKMLRSRAPALYGWDILLRGTLGPGPIISQKAGDAIRLAAAAGHEIGLHAWDHFRWQNYLERMSETELLQDFDRAFQTLAKLIGRPPLASANPAWRSTPALLAWKERYPFRYNSDCRGDAIFLPLLNGEPGKVPQIPTTLPTYDELIGTQDVTPENFNAAIWSRLRPEGLRVYTVHAEVEGIAYPEMFSEFLTGLRERGYRPAPLGDLLADIPEAKREALPRCRLVEREIPGREGRVAMVVAEREEKI
jgi:undecaprenyl phosphate-alpha-L-ara4FN deformylase